MHILHALYEARTHARTHARTQAPRRVSPPRRKSSCHNLLAVDSSPPGPAVAAEAAAALGGDDAPKVVWRTRPTDLVYAVALSSDCQFCCYGGRLRSLVVLDGKTGAALFQHPLQENRSTYS